MNDSPPTRMHPAVARCLETAAETPVTDRAAASLDRWRDLLQLSILDYLRSERIRRGDELTEIGDETAETERRLGFAQPRKP